MQLGLVTYMWGADWDLPTIFKNLEASGVLGVELRTSHKHGVELSLTAAERKDVARQFADSPVELVGLGTACEYHSPDSAELKKQMEDSRAFIQLCHDVGGSGIKVRPNQLPASVAAEKTIAQIGASLAELADFGDDFGVEIRLEVHGPGTSDLEIIRQIMAAANHPNAKVCWNCNPTDLDGSGLESNFAKVQDKIGTVHIHDLISDYPWQPFFNLLKSSGFGGWTLIEEGAPTADPVRVLTYYRLLWERMVA